MATWLVLVLVQTSTDSEPVLPRRRFVMLIPSSPHPLPLLLPWMFRRAWLAMDGHDWLRTHVPRLKGDGRHGGCLLRSGLRRSFLEGFTSGHRTQDASYTTMSRQVTKMSCHSFPLHIPSYSAVSLFFFPLSHQRTSVHPEFIHFSPSTPLTINIVSLACH